MVRDIYLQSFSYPLQLSLAGMAIIIAATLKIAFKFGERENISISDMFVCIVSIFGLQGSPKLPTTFIGSTILMIALLFSLLTFNVYSASITSKLSVQLIEISTPEELLYNTDLEVGFTPDIEDMLSQSDDPVLQEVYKRATADRSSFVMNMTQGIGKALTSQFAILGHEGKFRRAIKQLPGEDVCQVIVFMRHFQPKRYLSFIS